MTQIAYRCNLATKAFPFISARKARTTIVPGPDQVYNRYRSPAETILDVGMSEVMYMENVLPTVDGYRSVALRAVDPTSFVPSLITGAGGGVRSTVGGQFISGNIIADTVNDRANLEFYCDADVANRAWFFTFTYLVA